MIRKNISMEPEYLEKLRPFLEKNKGNLSAAIRDVIDLADSALEDHASVEEVMEQLSAGKGLSALRNRLIENGECVLVSSFAFMGLIRETEGILVEEDIVSELFNPYRIKTVSDLVEYLNTRSRNLGWGLEVSVHPGKDKVPEKIVVSNGEDSAFRALIAEMISIFLALYLDMDVSFVHRKSNSFQVYLKEYRAAGREIPPGVKKYFGALDSAFREIKNWPDFWIPLIENYRQHRYDYVSLPGEVFEAFLGGEVPDMRKYLEAPSSRPIEEIPLPDLVASLRAFASTTQLVRTVESELEGGKMDVKIRHRYSSEKTVSKLVEFFSSIFKAAGYAVEVKVVSNLIIYEIKEKAEKTRLEKVDWGQID
ncbi:MAG: hypothetical protein PHW56_00170 [Methanosarcinaceae archaeon]|nr:hypothetical protein [Methanosarcinaceae archaeon]